MTICNVCSNPLGSPIYLGGERTSLTTMNKFVPGQTRIYHCLVCDHVQTAELPDLERFYAEEYSINEAGVNDDQLYEVRDGQEIYRSEHQAAVALNKLDLAGVPKILDYGSAKGATLRRIVEASPNVEPYLFDVTDKYQSYWKNFPKPAKWASHRPDPAWAGTLDAVLSFYALEHIPHLGEVLAEIRTLLRPGGTFYFIVPNLYANWADFIVADHVNHFSRRSLTTMLEAAGFSDISIDETAHASAFVVDCRASDPETRTAGTLPGSKAAVDRLVEFWSTARERIAEQERGLDAHARVAIYGAGIYGNFILSCLSHPDRVDCFVDQNRFLHGTKLNGLEILKPDDAPDDLAAVFAGLNPLHARRILASVESLQSRNIPFFFLD
ncbi:methyltransferase domain-containing protein [Hoeflea sp.]|uniref:class I SAM-dependent methyltransferase n=1 Tax=Hoeflea sp. TaxID=1940281 RepID=UPI0019CE7AE7|nr:methyltransferase domain-containing protein [Hoeflea sp.]MBC7284519.1 methyltransferase domain-containing protein [Hoeflea sp.]